MEGVEAGGKRVGRRRRKTGRRRKLGNA